MMSKKLIDAMVNMREEESVQLARKMIDEGVDPMRVLDSCKEAMAEVGKRFEKGVYFLPELMMAGEMLRKISGFAKPKLAGDQKAERKGTVLIGTVEGDIHDIGKDIVVFMLDVNGFEVMDLGIDVPVQKFVDAVKEFKPGVVALSGFLTLAFDAMKATVEGLVQAGLRDRVKIMIGGGQIDDEVRKYTGADAYGLDAMAGVALANKWFGIS
jgi:5-methyltetrahydrofolate--homocysteine methyltransferase